MLLSRILVCSVFLSLPPLKTFQESEPANGLFGIKGLGWRCTWMLFHMSGIQVRVELNEGFFGTRALANWKSSYSCVSVA